MKDAVTLLLCAVALAHSFNHNPDRSARTCNCNPSEAEQICRANNNYGAEDVLIAHEYCDKFYKCAHGRPVAFFCPNNLLYNPYSERCDWPHEVDCGDRPISEGPPQNDDDNVDDVNKDFVCNCNPSEAPSICAAADSDGVLVAHENCNQFYQCAHRIPVTLNCPPSLLYNPYKEQCDWPNNVECGDRVIREPDSVEEKDNDNNNDNQNDGTCNCDPKEAPAICAAPGSESILVAHENCNQYYVCNFGWPVAMSCPVDLLFNPYTDQCDWPRNVDCGNRIIPEPDCTACNIDNNNNLDCNAVTTPSNDDNDDIDDRLPADDDKEVCAPEGALHTHRHCNKFYKCLNGEIVVLPCHGILLYNPDTSRCDLPQNVDCGDRIISDDDDSSGNSDSNESSGDGNGNDDPSDAPTICAADGSDGVLVAHENCNQFYLCFAGLPYPLECPMNLLFDPKSGECHWPNEVDCGDRLIPGTEPSPDPEQCPPGEDDSVSPPEETPTNCTANTPNGFLIEHENCNQYYMCFNGVPVTMTCPGNLHFNSNTGFCEHNSIVDCGDRLVPGTESSEDNPVEQPADNNSNNECPNYVTCNCDPDQAASICAGANSEGALVAHEYCNHFYKCAHGEAVPIKCPSNLVYNPIAQYCDWPFNVDCGERIIPDSDEDVNKSVESDDNKETSCNCNPAEAPTICAGSDSSGILVAHENCNQFYKCDHGRPVALSCPNNLLYNPYSEQCDWPWDVECGERVIPQPGDDNIANDNNDNNNDENNCNHKVVHDDPSQAPAVCATSGSDGVLVAHENCDQYYICFAGAPQTQPCFTGLLYNPTNNQCDWPSNVECGSRIIPRDQNECACNPRNAPKLCADPRSQGKLIAHENCNQFYTCTDAIPEAQTCPSNLLYNIDKEVCDWPQNVNCDNRILPYVSLNKHSRQSTY